MMTDLFSALDCNQMNFSFFLWGTPITILMLLSMKSKSSNVYSNLVLSVSGIHSDSREDTMALSLFSLSLMGFIISMNLIGLVPYVYGLTSNLWTAISMALVLWGMSLTSGWISRPAASAAHLAPSGAPDVLIPLLVLIETVSVLIRPLTLTVRLVANISAGHIVLSLLANCLTGVSSSTLMMLLVVNSGYMLFEVFVCIIQAYIFSLLIKLYAEEHP